MGRNGGIHYKKFAAIKKKAYKGENVLKWEHISGYPFEKIKMYNKSLFKRL
jgi:hypothetical protein